MKYLWLIGGMGLASILGSCDEGKIYPSEAGSGNEGFSVVMTGNVVGSSDYGSGYSLALAVFEEGSDFAEISKRVDGEEENSKDVELSNVNIKEGTAELCVINSLRKRVITFASLPVSGVKSGETITFNVGDVDVSQYGAIADRIFATTCIQCHGATGHSAAGLDLNREQAYAMLVDVASVVEPGKMRVAPGDSRESTLWEAVATDLSASWNFNHSNLLPQEQSGFIENWINNGAEK